MELSSSDINKVSEKRQNISGRETLHFPTSTVKTFPLKNLL